MNRLPAEDPDISLPQLRCFVAAVEAASLAEAGRRLGMSAASVSKAITRLEHSAGVRLLHRSTHGFSLTPEGEALLDSARAVVAAAIGFRTAAGGAVTGAAGGTVRVSVSVGLSRAVLAPLLAGFREARPEVRVEVRATNEIVSLADEGVDVALRSGSLDGVPGHIQHRWFTFPWVVCAAPSYIARRGKPASVEDLRSHDLIGFRNLRTGQVQGWPVRACDGAKERMAPDASLLFDDGDSGWQAALAGAGIACTPLYLAASSLRDGRAVELLPHCRDTPVIVSIIRRERRLTVPRVTAFVEYLFAHAPKFDDLD